MKILVRVCVYSGLRPPFSIEETTFCSEPPPKKSRHSSKATQKPTEAPSISRTATSVGRRAQHHHHRLSQDNDKRRASHLLVSDTDMLSVSGGFGGGTFRRPPYCKRFFGISETVKALSYTHKKDLCVLGSYWTGNIGGSQYTEAPGNARAQYRT